MYGGCFLCPLYPLLISVDWVPQSTNGMVRAGLAVGTHTRKESSRRDSGRIKKAEKRIQDQHKKYRVARRQTKQRDEEQWRQKEGTTYGAGAFSELTVATEPARKRKKR